MTDLDEIEEEEAEHPDDDEDQGAEPKRAFAEGCDVFLVKPHGFMELFKRVKETPPGTVDAHERLIIDQYGPRAYRG